MSTPKISLQDFYGGEAPGSAVRVRPVVAVPRPVVHPRAIRPPVERPPVRARPPAAVMVQVPAPLVDLIEAAQRVGHVGEQAADLFGKAGLAAIVGLAAYGGYRWYKSAQKPARAPRGRRVKQSLLPSGGK